VKDDILGTVPHPLRPHAIAAPTLAAAAYTALVCASLALFLYEIPIQLTDSFNHLLNVQGQSFGSIVRSYFFQDGYFRPFWWMETKAIFEASGGRYHLWFRGLHAVQTCVLVVLVVALLRPRTWTDAALVPLALAILIGSHTFNGLVQEAFPLNHYELAVIACVATALIAQANHRWWSDMAAVALFIVASFTVESGLLVAVVAVGAWLVGMRGLSGRGIVLIAALFVGYFVLRVAYLGSNPPGLIERSSGFGFQVLGPDALVARFAGNPLPFYAYNVITTALSVLFGEPRGGVFGFTKAFASGETNVRIWSSVVASTLGTLAIVLYARHRAAAWRARYLDAGDRLVLLFVIVLGGNAVMSYAYTKDVIAATAGVFFSCAVFVAVRDLVGRMQRMVPRRRVAALALLGLLVVTWAHRSAGGYVALRGAAYRNRVEWADPEDWLRTQDIDVARPEERALMLRLQGDALFHQPAVVPLKPGVRRLLEFD
jgi:hypothetical protein